MSKWRGLEKEWDIIDRDMLKVAEVLNVRLRDRVCELILKISKKYPEIKFEEILAGNGGVSIWGTIVDYEGQTVPLNHYLACGGFSAGVPDPKYDWGKKWDEKYPGLYKLAHELEEIWIKQDDSQYFAPHSIMADQMKKLLAKA